MNTHFALNIKLHDDCWWELYPFCFWNSEQKFIDDIRYDRGWHLQFGFWSTRILHYFHSSVRHGRDIATFLDNLDHEYHIFSESSSSTLIILTKDSLEVITKLGRQVSRQTGKEEDEIVRQLRQRVAMLLVRDNMNMFDSRTPSYPQAVIDADVDINV